MQTGALHNRFGRDESRLTAVERAFKRTANTGAGIQNLFKQTVLTLSSPLLGGAISRSSLPRKAEDPP